jgi:HD-GYP domain-containing protein (c-di-GMP phosphodiesterase class II)
MIRLGLHEVRAGMVLARSLVSDSGDLLLAAGFLINERILGKMKSMELSGCWVYEEGTELVVAEELITEHFANQVQGVLRDNAELCKLTMALKDDTLESLQKVLADPARFRNIIVYDRLKNIVKEIMDDLLKRDPVTINLNSIRHKNGWMHQHALDVTITSILLAQNLQFPYKEIEELALGCLLMDVGMVILADGLFKKKGPLTEEELALLREHPTFGYAILRENDQVPLTVAHIAYQHHERQDGNGYPRHLRGNNKLPVKSLSAEKGVILRYAEIASVADIYISLIAPRPGTVPPRSPEEAMKILILGAGTHLNRAIVDNMITMIPIYPVGSKIRVVLDKKYNLYVGFSGVVAKYRPENPENPVIIITTNRDKKKVKPFTLDMAEQKDMKIQYAKL